MADSQPVPSLEDSPPERLSIDYWWLLRWGMLWLLFIAMVNSYVDRGNMSYAIKLIQAEFGFGEAQRGWIFSLFTLGYALTQIPAGMVVDRIGIKWSYTISYFFWGLVAAAFGATWLYWHLVVLRLLLGFFEAVSGPASVAFIARYFPQSSRGLATGIFMSGTKIGPAFGAILATELIEAFDSWRLLFILCGLVPLLWLVPWVWGYYLVERFERDNPDAMPNTDRISPEPKAPTKTSVVPFSVLLGSIKTWGVFLGYFCYGYAWYMYISWLPSYLQEAQGMSLKEAGWWSAFAYGGLALVVTGAGLVSDFFLRHGFMKLFNRSLLIGGPAVAAMLFVGLLSQEVNVREGLPSLGSMLIASGIGLVAFIVLSLLISAVTQFFINRGQPRVLIRKTFIAAGLLLGALVIPIPFLDNLDVIKVLLLTAIAGTGFATANAWAITQTVAPQGSVGTMSGIQNFGATSGGFLGGLVPGYILAWTSSYAMVLFVAGGLMLVGIGSYFFLIGKLEPITLPTKYQPQTPED